MHLHLQNKLQEAVSKHEQSIAIWELSLGKEHPLVAEALNHLGLVYEQQVGSEYTLPMDG